jgi:hypothetical protein
MIKDTPRRSLLQHRKGNVGRRQTLRKVEISKTAATIALAKKSRQEFARCGLNLLPDISLFHSAQSSTDYDVQRTDKIQSSLY